MILKNMKMEKNKIQLVNRKTQNVIKAKRVYDDSDELIAYNSKGRILKPEKYVELIDEIESIDFYASLAKRTCPDLGDDSKNILHMIAGMRTELIEIEDMYKKSFAYGKDYDRVNHLEELADFMWYFSNLANIIGVKINLQVHSHSLKAGITGIGKYKVNYFDYDILMQANKAIFELLYIGKVIPSRKEEYFITLTARVNQYLSMYVKDSNQLYEALKNNINKLIVRYPNGFDSELSANRKLEQERKQLEK